MNSEQTSNRVTSLSEYRAARAARKALAEPAAPYLLWYPGLGYVQVSSGAAQVTYSPLPMGGNPHRF